MPLFIMKIHSKLFLSMVMIGILSLTKYTSASAQEAFPAKRLTWTEQGEVLVVGQKVSYKTVGSNHFEKGRITGISDSTFSFETNIPGMVITIPYIKLEAFKISGEGTFVSMLAVVLASSCLAG